ncbi:hypothetical protein Taro_000279 [Colocasia esculenta]|uniref:Uncharacterized protein n=1 Tax=Colocasia esculenta TaxID=4460 RepID=A0A843TG04_COLES|nr:hypothetical protein [Colocasia esculenta]
MSIATNEDLVVSRVLFPSVVKEDLVVSRVLFPSVVKEDLVVSRVLFPSVVKEDLTHSPPPSGLVNWATFTSCWGRVEEFLAAGEQEIVHTKSFFFPFSSAATCTNHPFEVDQRHRPYERDGPIGRILRSCRDSKPVTF